MKHQVGNEVNGVNITLPRNLSARQLRQGGAVVDRDGALRFAASDTQKVI